MTAKNLPALADLAARINEEHEACQTAMRSGLEHALNPHFPGGRPTASTTPAVICENRSAAQRISTA